MMRWILTLFVGYSILGCDGGAPMPDPRAPASVLSPELGGARDQYGMSVVRSGDTLMVGAPGTDSDSARDTGAVYVYQRAGAGWSLDAVLRPLQEPGSYCGAHLALDGARALVSCNDTRSQSSVERVLVYRREPSGWTITGELPFPGLGPTGLQLGFAQDKAVAMDNDGIYAFANLDAGWQLLNAVELERPSHMSIDRTTLIAAREGGLYTFTVTDRGVTQSAEPYAQPGALTTALASDTALLGIHYEREDNSIWLEVAALRLVGDTWREESRIVPSRPTDDTYYGSQMYLSNEFAVITAPGMTTPGGAAYVFARAGARWQERNILVQDNPAANSAFGLFTYVGTPTLVVDGHTAMISDYTDEDAGEYPTGVVYAFDDVLAVE